MNFTLSYSPLSCIPIFAFHPAICETGPVPTATEN
jgi:hypothetical protein